MKAPADLTPAQRDIRYLFARHKRQGQPPPTSDRATAYAERVAILVHDAGLSEHRARETACRPNGPGTPPL